MASLLNNASLLLNPAGSIIAYEEDKILSVLPRNGAGDFTFSGGDGGTRVNQEGYIEQTPANLITYSEDFSNWTGNLFSNWINSAVTANFAVAPNGTLTADRLGDGYARFNVSATAIPGQTYTFSIYLKNISLNADFYVYAAWGLNGTLVSYGAIGAQIQISQLSTTEWTRFTFSTTAPSSGINQMQFGPAPFTGYGTNPAGTFILAWGGMVNIGTTAKPYQPTTDRLNYPRITYQNGRGALLSEPQRTNLLTYSNVLSGQSWVPYRSTYTANATASPDGTTNAALTVWDGASDSSTGYYNTNITFAGSTTYCLSAFLKYYNKPIVNLGYADRSSPYLGGGANFNLVNGTFVSLEGDATSGIIEPYKDGWYKCTVIFTTVSSPSYNYVALNCDVDNAGEGFYTYGTQLEVGSFPTSYIPTTSATVTRPKDTTENSSASSVIGQTEGVLYADLIWDRLKGADDFLILTISNGTTANNLFLDIFNDTVVFGVDSSSSRVVQIQSSTITTGRHKMAGGYKNNDFVLYLDGKQIGTDTVGTVPACSVIDVGLWADGAYPFAGNLNTIGLFNTRLTNTQLAELTTIRSGSGGNISYYGPYTVHTFTGSATFTPSFNGQVEVLVVAGGGSGGGDVGGGGGGGQVLYNSSYGVTAGTGITVTIGAGGGYSTLFNSCGLIGSNSSFGGLSALGGGGGHGRDPSSTGQAPNTGWNGGGGSYDFSTATAGNGGFAGGNSAGGGTSSNGNGGGGGAGGVGVAGTTSKGGNGGPGALYSITGFATRYAGGGGGSFYSTTDRSKIGFGTDGGGDGGYQGNTSALDGVANTGGGGGGGGSTASPNNNGRGGTGIVIVRYLT
jgi:hypothetical protein